MSSHHVLNQINIHPSDNAHFKLTSPINFGVSIRLQLRDIGIWQTVNLTLIVSIVWVLEEAV